jgi:hypothetical protein
MPTMLVIHLPKDDRAGRCRINGEPCDFEIEGKTFRFRPADSPDQPWDEREIMQTMPGNAGLVAYICSDSTQAEND